MKTFISLTFLFLVNYCFGQPHASVETQDTTNYGKVYFLRSTGFSASAAGFKVNVDGAQVCKLKNNQYSIHALKNGEHTISILAATSTKKSANETLKLEIEPNKTYYINIMMQVNALTYNVSCEEIPFSSALKKMKTLEENKNCK